MVKYIPKATKRTIVFHMVAWMLYGVGMYLYNLHNYQEPSIMRIGGLVLLMAFAFYLILAFLFCITGSQKPIRWLCLGMLALIATVLFAYQCVYTWLPLLDIKLYVDEVPFTYRQFAYNAFRVLKEMGKYAVLYFIAFHLVRTKAVIRKSKQYIIHIWRKLRRHELQESKGAIAPHFIMNVFNHCHAYVRAVNASVARRLLYLSEVLDYSLDDRNYVGLRTVTLKKELEEMNHCQYAYYGREWDTSPIGCYCFGNIRGFRVPSFTLITCFQNMVKYAVCDPLYKQAFIRIGASGQTLVITGVNRVAKQEKAKVGKKLGLSNLSTRLHHQYGQRARLHYWEEQGIFIFLLIIHI